jgi:hypothetical protein
MFPRDEPGLPVVLLPPRRPAADPPGAVVLPIDTSRETPGLSDGQVRTVPDLLPSELRSIPDRGWTPSALPGPDRNILFARSASAPPIEVAGLIPPGCSALREIFPRCRSSEG